MVIEELAVGRRRDIMVMKTLGFFIEGPIDEGRD